MTAEEGVDVVRNETFLRRELDIVTFVCLGSRHQSRIPSSTEKQVLFHAGLGIMAQSIPGVSIPPGICWAFVISRFGN